MKIHYEALGLVVLLISGQSFSGSMGAAKPLLRPYAVINVGADFIRTGDAQTISLLPPFFNHYTQNSSYQSSGSLGLGTGVEGKLFSSLLWQAGVLGAFNSEVNSHGEVWQFALPEFNNFMYRYEIQTFRIVGTGKLLATYLERIHPYVSGELGAAFNAARSYQETALIQEAVPMEPFRNRTRSSFTWGVGTGADVDVNSNLRLGIGYEFMDLGQAKLGPSPAQDTTQTLRVRHLYDHQIRFQLTALL